MTHNDIVALVAQLRAMGYEPIPNHDKRTFWVNWNAADYKDTGLVDMPKGWPKRFKALGIRITDGVRVPDIDVDDPLAGRLVARLAKVAPQIYAEAPVRYGASPHKLALICRAPEGDEQFDIIYSRRYFAGTKAEYQQALAAQAAGGPRIKTHRVEIFGGGPARNGKVAKQLGVYGPHSHDERDKVLAEYSWDEARRELAKILKAHLPELSLALAWEIIRIFEEEAEAAGWQRVEEVGHGVSQDVVYDIDDDTLFDVHQGPGGIHYDELSAIVERRGEARVSSKFWDGISDHRRDKCQCSWMARYQCVGVYDHEEASLHLPKSLAPVDTDKLGEALRAHAEATGAAIPPATPNWCERYKNGAPRPTLRNARIAVEASGLICSHDVFHHRMYLGRDAAASPREPRLPFIGELTDANIGALRVYLAYRYDRDFTEVHIRNAVVTLANENQFDPVLELLAEAEANWDGVQRLDRMAADFLACEDTELNARFVRKTMIAAVARARVPGIKFDTIFVMVGPQGYNKSSAWALLAGAENFSDERLLGHNTREVQELLSGIWIHENAELAGMTKADVETVTAFASRVVDRARPAYGHILVAQPRRSIEVGTTNSPTFLQSQYGNRRFWPAQILAPIDLHKLKAHRLQLLGEAAHYQSEGESLVLDEHLWGAAAIAQEERRVVDPWEDKLARIMLVPATTSPIYAVEDRGMCVIYRDTVSDKVSTSDLFTHVLKIPAGQMHNAHSKRLSQVMQNLGWEKKLVKIEGETVRGYQRAAPVTRPVTRSTDKNT